MGAGASSALKAIDHRLLTTIHLPHDTTILLEGESTAMDAVVSKCMQPGLLLRGDVLVFVQGARVTSCAHAQMLLSPEARQKAAVIPNMPSNVLRVLVQRAPKTEAVLERPPASSADAAPFGLHLVSRGVSRGAPSVGVEIAAIAAEGIAATSGALVIGSEITHVDGEEVSSAARVSMALRNASSGSRITLTLRHVPRSSAYEPPAWASVPRLAHKTASGGGKPGTQALVSPTPRIAEISPLSSPTGSGMATGHVSAEEVEMFFV